MKQQLAEQNKRSTFDWALALRGQLRLDSKIAKLLYPNYGKHDWFRHTTDNEGAVFLANQSNEKITVAAEKLSQGDINTETDGDVLMHLKAKYVAWFPFDVYSSVDNNSTRWIDATTVDQHSSNESIDIFPEEMIEELKLASYEYLQQQIISSDWMKELIQLSPFLKNRLRDGLESESRRNMFIKRLARMLSVERDLDEAETRIHQDDVKQSLSVVADDMMDIAYDIVKHYSEQIHTNTINAFVKLKKSYYRKHKRYHVHLGWDEALVNNIDARSVLFKVEYYFIKVVEMLALKIDYLEDRNELDHPLRDEVADKILKQDIQDMFKEDEDFPNPLEDDDDDDVDELMGMFGMDTKSDIKRQKNREKEQFLKLEPTVEWLNDNPDTDRSIARLRGCKEAIAQIKDKDKLVIGFCDQKGSVKDIGKAITKNKNQSIQDALNIVLQFVGLERDTKTSSYFKKKSS
jgi:hypothetical protein